MKTAVLILAMFSGVCLATTREPREVHDLRAREAQLQVLIAEIRWLYRGDSAFIAAFDLAQRKWEEYCSAMLDARFPRKKKQEAYGSVFEVAYAAAKRSLVEARIKDVSLWADGTEEGDVSKGSVKLKAELDEIRKKKKG